MDTRKNCQWCIIGGGASGLAAAALLSRKAAGAGVSRGILVMEKNPRVGKKLLSTGNGRCNLGNISLDMSKYHGDVDLVREVFANWQGAQSFFADLGLICKADSAGRLYPYSNTANSVLDTLRFACTHAELLCDTECRSVKSCNGGFLINGSIFAEKLIWATGGEAPRSGFHILEQLGHTIVEPFPALCPVITDKALTRSLKGLRIYADCRAVVGEKVIKQECGEVQFNEGWLSGICIMNLSRLVRDYGNSLTISLDIAPEFTAEQLQTIGLSGLFHRRIAEVFAKKPTQAIKDWRFPVTGVASWGQAQITAGGVPASQLNSDLSSKLCSGLYVIGEAVNVDGDCGGYNLEWAWASAKQCTIDN